MRNGAELNNNNNNEAEVVDDFASDTEDAGIDLELQYDSFDHFNAAAVVEQRDIGSSRHNNSSNQRVTFRLNEQNFEEPATAVKVSFPRTWKPANSRVQQPEKIRVWKPAVIRQDGSDHLHGREDPEHPDSLSLIHI